LFQELRTVELLRPHVLVGNPWQNTGIRSCLLSSSYQIAAQLRVAPPTDPYVHALVHTVRQRTGLQCGRHTSSRGRPYTSEASQQGYGGRMTEPRCAPPGAPCGGRPPAAPFPSPGPPRRVPRLPRYYGAVRLPGSLASHAVAFAWRYQALCLSLRSLRSRTQGRGPGVRRPVPTAGTYRLETFRASQVPGKPQVPIRTGSSTPAGLHAPYRDGAAARPPLEEQRRLLPWDFRSSIAWLFGSLSTLRRVSCPTTYARLASRCGLGFPGRA
jgi:hypothetical protein